MKTLLLLILVTLLVPVTTSASFFYGELELICSEDPTTPGRAYRCSGGSGTWYNCYLVSGQLYCVAYEDTAYCPAAGPGICY